MITFAKNFLSAGLGGLALGLLALPIQAAQPAALSANLPLYFEAGAGQGAAQFIACGHDYQFLISPTEVQIALRRVAAEPGAVRMQFVGANAGARVEGGTELPGKINYFTGNDPAQWRRGLAMFANVRASELYRGVNLVYYGNQQQLEYDFAIAPGADPGAVAIHFDGADRISITPEGELVVSLSGGEIRQHKPEIYQTVNGMRKEIAGGYRLVDPHTAAFAIGEYDRNQELVIDPVLNYSSYFGGTAGDTAWAVASDTNGFVYITGETFSPKFFTNGWSGGPAFSTFGAFQTNYNGGKYAGDAFVAKFSTASNHVFYLTYLGGNGDNAAYSIAVDNAGNAYVAGYTDATNFPTTNAIPGHTNISGVLDPTIKLYPSEAFVAELDASGSNLVYSTYLGGNGADAAYGVAVDSFGHAFVTGFTYSTNFPTTTNALFTHLQCTNSFSFNANAFVTEIASNGSALVYSTYFGGTNYDVGKGIAVDTNGYVYVTGFTASTNFPTTNFIQQLINSNLVDGHVLNRSTNRIAYDAFVAKFDPTGTNLVYSTLLGSTNNDVATSIAVDNTGAAYVTGWTISSNFPTLGTNVSGLYSYVATNTSSSRPATNVFLTKITYGTNAVIEWSALFGGRGADVGYGVAVDPAGEVFVTGSASSTNFPVFNVPGYLRATNSGKSDAFVIGFNTNATALLYSAYLGGKEDDFGYGIAVDTNGNAYVVGQTLSTNFPTLNTTWTNRNGTNDAFLTEIVLTVPAPEITVTVDPTNQSAATASTVTFTVTVTNSALAPFSYQWLLNGTNLVNGTNSVSKEIITGATNFNTSATNSILIIRNAQPNDSATNYSVIVTNFGGSATISNILLLVTNIPPLITVQPPTNQTAEVGSVVTFAVTATGTAPLSYQWQTNGTNLVNGGRISGATNATLTIGDAMISDSGNYTVIVTNAGGSVTSAVAVLTVTNFPPSILVSPKSQTVAVGKTVNFTVTADGTVPLHYQWQTNGIDLVNGGRISGATNAILIISNVQTNDSATNYTVVVTNVAGSATSAVATLTVTAQPIITVPPTNQIVEPGATAIFAVTAVGTPTLRYQWRTNEVNLADGGRINGANTAALTISNVQTNDSAINFTVIVTNSAGSVTSAAVVLTVTNFPPAIVVQPTNRTVDQGKTVNFAVTATGTAPLHYQWQTNGIDLVNGGRISGATNATLIISNVQTNDSGTNYTVIVTNLVGSVTSSVAALTVLTSPVILVQPTNQGVAVGATATFAVTVSGAATLHYQWLQGNVPLANYGEYSGVTTYRLTITDAQTYDSGTYRVVVTNAFGSVTSSNATLTVTNVPPAIIVQPTNQLIGAGATATFVVTATGTAPLSYQWQVNGTNLIDGGRIAGATTNTLTLNDVQTNDYGNYTVIVTNAGGAVTSAVAVLTVQISPVITMQPTNRVVGVGDTATLAVTAVGMVPLSYQWQVDGTNLVNGGDIAGATTNVLTISNAQTTNSGTYSVIVTNLAGSVTSSNAVLTVTALPVILVQPTNQSLAVGDTAILVVTAVGLAPLHYQWQTNGIDLVNGGRISGATNTTLVITNAQTTNSGSYTVIVTNLAGLVISSNAILTVLASPSFSRITAGSDGSFILSGVGGANGGTYYVLASSNLLLPLGSWTPIATNQFDNNGDFIFTNTAQTNTPQLFYLLQLP